MESAIQVQVHTRIDGDFDGNAQRQTAIQRDT